ncbi:MAG: radical SAM protein [Syntrophorhabdaceae bacterium]|nr:radical SAM protein [Syntrophorhabdaceae bacterium]
MTEHVIKAVGNANFTSLSGSSVPQESTPEYAEYRRCWLNNPAGFILRDFPMHLDIEITNRCNLRCTFCDKLPLLTKDQMGDMEIELFKKIIDEGEKGRLWGVKLSYRGEPLLHPQVAEMVAYAKSKGVLDIYMNTNGMLLSEEMSLKLMDAGLDRISVSVDGTDAVVFERERRGAKYDRILKNVETLMALREERGYPNPKVRVQTVRLPGLDMEDYTRFWSSRCDEVGAVDFKEVIERNIDIVKDDWACPQLWQRMTIEWDGTIMACNNDDFRLLSPGNVRTRTVFSSWQDPLVQEARGRHRAGRSHEVAACKGCPWRTTQILKLLK